MIGSGKDRVLRLMEAESGDASVCSLLSAFLDDRVVDARFRRAGVGAVRRDNDVP
jgi:hypothetical protein